MEQSEEVGGRSWKGRDARVLSEMRPLPSITHMLFLPSVIPLVRGRFSLGIYNFHVTFLFTRRGFGEQSHLAQQNFHSDHHCCLFPLSSTVLCTRSRRSLCFFCLDVATGDGYFRNCPSWRQNIFVGFNIASSISFRAKQLVDFLSSVLGSRPLWLPECRLNCDGNEVVY